METLHFLVMGFSTALQPENLFAAFSGAVVGLIVGALPGMGSITGVALLLPLTFKMNPTTAIIMLAAIYYSNMYGGSFSSILINIPGDSPAVMTAMDGYPMARNGQAGKALFTSSFASFCGGTIGIVILSFLGPTLARWGLNFGPPEMAWIILFALTSIGWIIGENPLAGLLATALGAMIATVGMTPSTGRIRFTFDILYLMRGVGFVPLVIGMFGFAKVIDMVLHPPMTGDTVNKAQLTIRGSVYTREEYKRCLPVVGRSGIMGTFVGVLPGAGATMAAFFAYIVEKRIGGNRDKIGTGVLEGVAAPEAANNGASIGAFAPMLALGVPGSATTAVLMGGLMMWGLTPGPLLFRDKPDFVWSLISSLYVGNLMCIIVAILAIPFLSRVVHISSAMLVPIISALCVVGAFSANGSLFDVGLMLSVSVLSYLMQIHKLPTAPLLLAYVLYPMLERYVAAALGMSSGRLYIFFHNPTCWMLILLIIAFCLTPVIVKLKNKRKNRRTSAN